MCRSTNQSGRIAVEDLNSVDLGRGCLDRGPTEDDDARGVDGKDRLKPGEAGGRRKWNGTAVGEDVEVGDCEA